MIEQDKTNPNYWGKQITPELRKRGENLSLMSKESLEIIKSAHPTHPHTEEVGEFERFAGTFPQIKPIYRTKSGEEFTPNS